MSLVVPAVRIAVAAQEPADPPTARLRLTLRQAAVLRLLIRGCTHRKVGRFLGMTEQAVTQNVVRARLANGADTTPQLVYLATKAGLLDAPVPELPRSITWKRGAGEVSDG